MFFFIIVRSQAAQGRMQLLIFFGLSLWFGPLLNPVAHGLVFQPAWHGGVFAAQCRTEYFYKTMSGSMLQGIGSKHGKNQYQVPTWVKQQKTTKNSLVALPKIEL